MTDETSLVLLLLAAGATLALLLLVVEVLKKHHLFAPEVYPLGLWSTDHLSTQPTDETIITSDGVQLHAWHFRSRIQGAPLIIWFHGNAGNLSTRAGVAAGLAARGAETLLFDYRGYGRSHGRPTERGLHLDSLAAYDYARDRLGGSGRIFLYGESLGGPYAARVATERKCCGVILENSFPSLASMARIVYPGLPLSLLVRRSLTALKWLNEAGVPVLVIHGKQDELIPFALGQEMFDNLRVPKRMFTSQTAKHSEVAIVEGERYFEAVISFVDENGPCTIQRA
ncbi:MAG: alpha/beta hydrolase [Acidobacteriota bacterium]